MGGFEALPDAKLMTRSIWFWTRDQVPDSVNQSGSSNSMDLSDWGPPSAAYVNTTCSIEQFFGPQKLVIGALPNAFRGG